MPPLAFCLAVSFVREKEFKATDLWQFQYSSAQNQRNKKKNAMEFTCIYNGPMGQGPYGPRHIWARAHMGQGPYGPGPIWARAHMGPGPIWARAHKGPGPGPSLSRRTDFQKMHPKKQVPLCILGVFTMTKKTRSAILSNLVVVSRRDLCSEAQW